jgi:hypothetical protein
MIFAPWRMAAKRQKANALLTGPVRPSQMPQITTKHRN